MPSRKRLAVAALVVLVVAGVAVGVFGRSLPESDARAVAIADRTANATTNVTKYTFDVRGRAVARAKGEERRATYDGRGAFNRTTRRYFLRLTLDGDEETRYLRGHTAYRPCPFSRYVNVENASYAVSLPENRSWTTYTLLGGQRRLYDVSHLYYRGTTTIGGERTHELLVVPNQRKLRAFTRGVPSEGDPNRNLQNVSATLYVSTETSLPRRIVVERTRGTLFGPTLRSRIVYDVTYGATTVPRPDATVASEDACPEP
ncbi:MAG: hypothetical protein ABEJ78_09795 [Haloferacaceae archaeon]